MQQQVFQLRVAYNFVKKNSSSEPNSENTSSLIESKTISQNYMNTLEIWQKAYEEWQKAGESALKQYAKAMEEASKGSNVELVKKYNELWENTWKNIGGDDPYSWYQKIWEDLWKESGFASFNSFNEYWQNIWKNTSTDTFKKSIEAFEKLNEKLSKPGKTN